MIEKTCDVLGVGIAAVDDLLTVDKYPPANVKVPVLAATRHGGGPACTAMAAVAALGGRAVFVARLGEDELSLHIRRILAARGVNLSYMISDPAGRPYHSRIVIDRSTGERTIFYDNRFFEPISAADLPDGLLAASRVLLLDFLCEPAPVDLAKKARHAGVPVIIDMEGRSPHAVQLLEQVDHLVAPEEFAQWFTGERDLFAACARLAKKNRAATVVTAGAAGCWWTDSPDRPPTHLPAFPVEAVDTTGCGDTYHGAYALAIARGFCVPQAVLFAAACGALKACGRGGGWDALPTSRQVCELLRQRLAADDPMREMIDKIEQANVVPIEKKVAQS